MRSGFLASLIALAVLVSCSPVNNPPVEKRIRLVELFSWWTAPGEAEALRALISLHQDTHPQARMFNAAAVDGTSAREALSKRLLNHEPPDFFQGNAHELAELLAKNPRALQSLDDLYDQLSLRQVVVPEILEDLEVDGHIIAMPVNVHRENTLFFNRQIFDRVGLLPPKTAAELMLVCERLKQAGVVPIATSHQGWITRIMFHSVAMGELGGENYVNFVQGKIGVEKSGIRRAIARLGRLLSEYSNSDAGEEGYGWTQAASAVFQGEAAMFFHGDWAKGYFQSLGWKPGEDFGATGAPGANEVFLYGVDVFALPEGAPNSEGARDFLATVASTSGQELFNAAKGSSTMRMDVDPARLDPVARETAHDLKNARFRFLVRAPPVWDEAFGRFAADLDEEALYQVLLKHPPEPQP